MWSGVYASPDTAFRIQAAATTSQAVISGPEQGLFNPHPIHIHVYISIDRSTDLGRVLGPLVSSTFQPPLAVVFSSFFSPTYLIKGKNVCLIHLGLAMYILRSYPFLHVGSEHNPGVA